MTLKQIKAVEKVNQERILKVNAKVPERSGIYFLTREESGFKYAYIGQAKNLLQRLAGHLRGYQHIDLSLKKHGLFSTENPNGWKVNFLEFPESLLDEKEQMYIKNYANAGYQLRNHTAGSQGSGKFALDNNAPAKGYREGVSRGYLKAQKEVAHLFEKYLRFDTKSENPGKLEQKAKEKFEDFLKFEE